MGELLLSFDQKASATSAVNGRGLQDESEVPEGEFVPIGVGPETAEGQWC